MWQEKISIYISIIALIIATIFPALTLYMEYHKAPSVQVFSSEIYALFSPEKKFDVIDSSGYVLFSNDGDFDFILEDLTVDLSCINNKTGNDDVNVPLISEGGELIKSNSFLKIEVRERNSEPDNYDIPNYNCNLQVYSSLISVNGLSADVDFTIQSIAENGTVHFDKTSPITVTWEE
jgi:hypothetical protein